MEVLIKIQLCFLNIFLFIDFKAHSTQGCMQLLLLIRMTYSLKFNPQAKMGLIHRLFHYIDLNSQVHIYSHSIN